MIVIRKIKLHFLLIPAILTTKDFKSELDMAIGHILIITQIMGLF